MKLVGNKRHRDGGGLNLVLGSSIDGLGAVTSDPACSGASVI